MAALIYGGGLRVSECCELRVRIGQPDTDLGRDRTMQGMGMPNLVKMLVQT